jgi:hypothetical protein
MRYIYGAERRRSCPNRIRTVFVITFKSAVTIVKLFELSTTFLGDVTSGLCSNPDFGMYSARVL